ncbi:hypothetical protein WDU94_006652 [Cyamophila willieti]
MNWSELEGEGEGEGERREGEGEGRRRREERKKRREGEGEGRREEEEEERREEKENVKEENENLTGIIPNMKPEVSAPSPTPQIGKKLPLDKLLAYQKLFAVFSEGFITDMSSVTSTITEPVPDLQPVPSSTIRRLNKVLSVLTFNTKHLLREELKSTLFSCNGHTIQPLQTIPSVNKYSETESKTFHLISKHHLNISEERMGYLEHTEALTKKIDTLER